MSMERTPCNNSCLEDPLASRIGDLEGTCAVGQTNKHRNDHENKATLLLDPNKDIFVSPIRNANTFGDETESNTNHILSTRAVHNVPMGLQQKCAQKLCSIHMLWELWLRSRCRMCLVVLWIAAFQPFGAVAAVHWLFAGVYSKPLWHRQSSYWLKDIFCYNCTHGTQRECTKIDH